MFATTIPSLKPKVAGIAALMCVGCHFSTLPDPNDPRTAPPAKAAKMLRQQIQTAADELNLRVLDRQITDDQRKAYLAERAKDLLSEGDPQHSLPQDAWIYADLYMTENDYKDAIPLLQKAVQYATETKNDDRRVNDSFRLAVAMAHEGQIEPALDLARKVIDSKPIDPGPVLPSVLLELTPVAEGKGHDEQLAKLLEASIGEHMRMKVDPNTLPGRAFLVAKPHLVFKAWQEILFLFNSSGHPEETAAAEALEKSTMDKMGAPPNL